MAKRNIGELAAYMRASRSQIVKAHSLTVIKVTQQAEAFAKDNAKAQFIGRNDRKLTGRLLNSIFSSYSFNPGASLPKGYIGTRGIPYGAIHEFGGVIEPVRARQLWIKQWSGKAGKGQYKRMTPTDFFNALRNQRIAQRGNGREKLALRFKDGKISAAGIQDANGQFTPLFFTADKVKIPARPYLVPAVREAVKLFPRQMGREIGRALSAKFFGKR